MARGQLAIVLHAHLPYVRHPEFPSFLEERWLFEAMMECYLPLLQRFRDLSRQGIPFRLTLVLTPTLVHMLRDEVLSSRFHEHLLALQELARREEARLAGSPDERKLAGFYRNRFDSVQNTWEECGHDIVGAFAELEERGHLEIMTCAATHGFLPLLSVVPQAVKAQVAVATAEHRRHFGRAARGFWLPECGYYPGVDEVLTRHSPQPA